MNSTKSNNLENLLEPSLRYLSLVKSRFGALAICLSIWISLASGRRNLGEELIMDSGLEETTGKAASSSSSLGDGGNEAADFECNICFELAQDPVVTLCGHLYCWPCLYRWLRHHSNSHECPVCKALIQEEKLVPLYGRGKKQTDPRSKSYPGMEIPHRPAGPRPETASIPPQGSNQFPNFGFGLLGGFIPMAYVGTENFAISTALGGLIPALFSVQLHGFQNATMHGTAPAYPFGFNGLQNDGITRGIQQPVTGGQEADSVLKNLFLLIGVFVMLGLICW
ncbi:hypothetical protein MLD38_007739 [Melastoma candidum]|uniref:Uncharacterized protein n=1 Tax=Melastoma candidum TaxID=119954 RepID=A0ACB9RS15_9MYRT|nr:hypothetical protein MLD38_007739 [Melastoma candidum]